MVETLSYITDFDSSTSMLFALSFYLKNKDFKGVGITPDFPGVVGDAINMVPDNIRTSIYRWSGWVGAIDEKEFDKVSSDEISEWVVSQYPEGKYPAVMIGSSNGAATNLAAALRIPWLPQTFLLSGRRSLHPDEVRKDAEWGKKAIQQVLSNNPDLHAFQMHDPLQDRLMVEKMGYFRLKKSRLGKVWEDYLKSTLQPGGTILTVECTYPWLLYRLGERHTFQIGGLGGLTPEEYINGSPKIDKFLQEYETDVRSWSLEGNPHKDIESEWGFLKELEGDLQRFAKENGYQVKRIRFEDPEAMSFFTADIHRWWYKRLGRPVDRLLVECFALLTPRWAIKSGSIPFWMAFNTHSSSRALEKYIAQSGPFKEIFLMLMSNGVDNAIDLTSIEEWRKLISQAKSRHEFIGVDEERYPSDFGTFLKYHADLEEKVGAAKETYPDLTLNELQAFIQDKGKSYEVEFADNNETAKGNG